MRLQEDGRSLTLKAQREMSGSSKLIHCGGAAWASESHGSPASAAEGARSNS